MIHTTNVLKSFLYQIKSKFCRVEHCWGFENQLTFRLSSFFLREFGSRRDLVPLEVGVLHEQSQSWPNLLNLILKLTGWIWSWNWLVESDLETGAVLSLNLAVLWSIQWNMWQELLGISCLPQENVLIIPTIASGSLPEHDEIKNNIMDTDTIEITTVNSKVTDWNLIRGAPNPYLYSSAQGLPFHLSRPNR